MLKMALCGKSDVYLINFLMVDELNDVQASCQSVF